MNVDEIESAIAQLSPSDVEKLSEWLAEYQGKLWDKQIAQDQQNGRLDQLLDEVEKEFAAGRSDLL